MSQTQNKTQATAASVSDFVAAIKNETARNDTLTLIKLMEKISGEPAVLWGPSIIGFGRYRYRYESGREGEVGAIGFSPRQGKLCVYLGDGTECHSELLDKLGPHTTGKVCLYVKRLSDIDMQVLEKIIRASYKYVMARKDSMHKIV
jgi:hypothetical protein